LKSCCVLQDHYDDERNKIVLHNTVSGLFAPRYFRSSERKFLVGTFAPRSENTGERKLPEPLSRDYSIDAWWTVAICSIPG